MVALLRAARRELAVRRDGLREHDVQFSPARRARAHLDGQALRLDLLAGLQGHGALELLSTAGHHLVPAGPFTTVWFSPGDPSWGAR